MAVSPDQSQVAAVTGEKLIVCDLKTSAVLASTIPTHLYAAATTAFRSVTYSPDGRRLAVGGDDGTAAFLDAVTLQPLTAPTNLHAGHITDIAYALGGSVLATGGGFGTGIKLTDVASGQLLMNFSAVEEGFFSLQPLAVGPDGTLASGGMDHTIRLWHPELNQETAILMGHSGSILCLAFAEHGNALISGSLDGTLRIWRALSFEEIEAQERTARSGRLK
jgi:WD40 repeat protein